MGMQVIPTQRPEGREVRKFGLLLLGVLCVLRAFALNIAEPIQAQHPQP
jgi:hypothetical protein